MYDWKVQTRNQKLIIQAARTSAVVSEMFPENMRERVMQQAPLTTKKKGNLKAFLNDGKDGALDPEKSSKPLADLFLETTVIFADIVGKLIFL